MIWLETRTNEEAAAVHWQHGDPFSSNALFIEGKFWTEELSRVKDQPTERIAVAKTVLPIPAAWREIALGLRVLIREKRKAKKDYSDELRKLHNYAAVHSFGYLHERDGGSYDDFALVPYQRITNLDLSYDSLGCDELSLLNQTDRKWMKERWGEPNQHTTASKLHRAVHSMEMGRASKAYDEHRRRERENFQRMVAMQCDESEAARANTLAGNPPKPKAGFWKRLFG